MVIENGWIQEDLSIVIRINHAREWEKISYMKIIWIFLCTLCVVYDIEVLTLLITLAFLKYTMFFRVKAKRIQDQKRYFEYINNHKSTV